MITKTGARFHGRRFACAVGRCGIGKKRGEGDNITPRGIHRIESIHARSDRFASAWQSFGIADMWSDDPCDLHYNALKKWPSSFSAERLRRADPLYDLVAVLDYNRAPIIAGAGSAIFLHVWRRPRYPTAGCIAFSRRDLNWILSRWVDKNRVIVQP